MSFSRFSSIVHSFSRPAMDAALDCCHLGEISGGRPLLVRGRETPHLQNICHWASQILLVDLPFATLLASQLHGKGN
jgi:hypothetical protein